MFSRQDGLLQASLMTMVDEWHLQAQKRQPTQ